MKSLFTTASPVVVAGSLVALFAKSPTKPDKLECRLSDDGAQLTVTEHFENAGANKRVASQTG
jgi:hypothetical protein